MIKHFLSLAGEEALLYSQFLKEFAMRERINDITNPKVVAVGDVELPKNALYHYTPILIGEVGPSNTAPFIGNYDGRVNVYFDWDYEHDFNISSIRIRPINKITIEKNYFKGHFTLFRARNYTQFLSKERELLVNNLCPGRLTSDYVRVSPFTLFNQNYNEWLTAIKAINQFAEISQREQFIDIRLPKTFPTYGELKIAYDQYINFFDDKGYPSKTRKETLKHFQTNKSFWLLDLYGFLLGHQFKEYSLFNKLSANALNKLTLIFSYQGKVIFAKLSTLRNLIAIHEDENQEKLSSTRINSFKYFYVRLISMVASIKIEVDDKENENEKEEELPLRSETLGDSDHSDSIHDSNGNDQKFDDIFSIPKGEERGEDKEHIKEEGGVVSGTGDEERTEEQVIQFGDDIPDEVFEQIKEEVNVVENTTNYTPTSSIERQLNEKAKAGKLTTKEKEYFTRISQSYKDIDIDGRTIEEIIDIKPEDMVIDDIDLIEDDVTLVDKSSRKSRTFMLSKGYVNKLLQRNIVEMIAYVQNSGVALTGLEKETVITADSKYVVWKLQLQPLEGKASTRYMRVPLIDEDGTFTINDVKSYMQLLRYEKPIRKVNPTTVQLTSYYDKPRIRIERSKMVVNNYVRWLKLRIIEKSVTVPDFKLVLGKFKAEQDKVCYYYSILAERFKSISYKGYEFNFNTPELIGTDKSLHKLCNDETWVIGKYKQHWIIIDKSGFVTVNGEAHGYIEEILDINIVKAPLPLSTININGYKFPAVVVLSYWMGFSQLLKEIKAHYRTVDPNVRVKLDENEYAITLADEKMIFNRKDELTTLIISGLRKIEGISNFTRTHLDDPNIWFGILNDGRVKASHFKEMTLMYKMFIDPITKRLLEKDRYPIVLDKLCIAGLKLLLSNESKHETAITEQRFVGYERIAGHIYRELCKEARQFDNKPNTGKKSFDLNPEAVMLNIITDSSVQAVEEVNPIHQNKQQEEVTFGGTMGRAEVAMVRRTRGMQEEYTGIISEAGKDSSKVGFVSYLTSDAKLVDYYGNVNVNQKPTKAGMGSVTLNTLYGGTHDDQYAI